MVSPTTRSEQKWGEHLSVFASRAAAVSGRKGCAADLFLRYFNGFIRVERERNHNHTGYRQDLFATRANQQVPHPWIHDGGKAAPGELQRMMAD